MQILTPISSYQTRQHNEIILIDSGRLADWYGLAKELPKVVCKTSIKGDLEAGWGLYIQENNEFTWLVGEKAGAEYFEPLDVIPLIGHKLMLMHWQKLVFRCLGESCYGVSFIDLTGGMQVN
ncbi:hypothetical protein [Rheinheimera oceanensis]|uniref:hypothetical protein n=1 Tax=Rheinheimera oceanensis TaxID=2817449 RepID=UPI001BFDBA45|nr:hypothetical protein [Rheinheimera oceanensis]